MVILDKGKLRHTEPGEKPDYSFTSSSSFFSPVTNLITGLSGVSGQRVMIGDKQSLQASSLVKRERPWAQSIDQSTGKVFVEEIGREMAQIFAKHEGEVTKVTPHEIVVKEGKDEHVYKIHDHFPTGKKGFTHHTSKVKVGDKVKKGQLMATSNFTDDKGVLSLGTNLKTQVMPFRSMNFEDAYAVTETGAKKLEIEQMFTIRFDKHGVELGRDKFLSFFPNKYQDYSHIGQDGVVKKGSKLQSGDPVVLALRPRTLRSIDMQLGKLQKVLKSSFNDQSEAWEYTTEGEVMDVGSSADSITVTVKTSRQMHTGDKLNVGFGQKGVATIVPDSIAPVGEDGKPVDLILNTMSITSRIAPALLSCIAQGKVGQKLGKPVDVPQFQPDHQALWAKGLLEKHGVKDKEKLYDPQTGHHIEVFTGPLYVNRLVHVAEDKVSARDTGGYTMSNQPSKGGECFHPSHDVLTVDGWCPVSELQPGMLCYTLNCETGKTELSEVEKMNAFDFDGELFGVSSRKLEMLVTPNHRLPLRRLGRDQSAFDAKLGFEQIEVSNMRTSGGYAIPIASDMQAYPATPTELPQLEAPSRKSRAGRPLSPMPEVSWRVAQLVTGLYLGDGNSIWNERCGNYGIELTQKDPRKDRILRRYMAVTGLDKAFRFDKSSSKYVYLNKTVASFFKPLGHSHEKRIPKVFFGMPRNVLKALLMGLLLTDGSGYLSQTESLRYVTTSKGLADDVQHLCFLLGYRAKISVRDGGNIVEFFNGYRSVARTSYNVCITRDQVTNLEPDRYRREGLSSQVPYVGKVYCPTMAKNGTVYTRLNGNPHWSCNSGAKRVGNLSTSSILSNSQTQVLRDIGTIRGTRNDDYWRQLKLGQPLPTPKVPFVFHQFIANLKGAGVNVHENGSQYQLMPMTSQQVKNMSQGQIKEPLTYRVKDEELIPEEGGLFDQNHVGLMGDQWNHVDLNHKVPNPISEDNLRKLLGVTKDKFMSMVTDGSLEKTLSHLDVAQEFRKNQDFIRSGKATKRDDQIKNLAFLRMLKTQGIHPKDLMLQHVPVIPQQFRPIVMAQGKQMGASVNELYKDMMLVNQGLTDTTHLPDDIVNDSKKQLYNSVKAVFGLGDPVNRKSVEKNYKGLLQTTLGLRGGSAKSSFFHQAVVNKPVDGVGRATLVPDTTLDMDQARIPHDVAWKIFSPYVIRRLVMQGLPQLQAKEYVEQRKGPALQALQDEMTHRPQIVSRDPQLHRYNSSGMFSLLNADPHDQTIKLNPLVFKSYNADADGDALGIQIPSSEEARQEVVDKMLPSKMLINHRNFLPMYTPSNEAALGLFLQSQKQNSKEAKTFKTKEDMLQAWKRGDIHIDDNVKIGAH